jgi:hypothetical protein
MEKRRINVYLDTRIVELAHLETNNLSELINNLLENYLNVSTTKEVDNQIKQHSKALKVLEQKKKALLLAGISDNKVNGMVKSLEDELRSNYMKRREQGVDDSADADFQWMNSPKNIQRCKLLGKEPIELVMDLRKWYSSKQTCKKGKR